MIRTITLGVLATAASLCSAQDERPIGPRHVRVIWTEAPQTTAVISWETYSESGPHRVRIDERTVEAQRSRQYSTPRDTATDLWFHHARIAGLEPSKRYEFTVHSGTESSRRFHFVTAPDDDRGFALLFSGDSRSNRQDRRKMNQRIAALSAARSDILAFAHGGDYIVNGRALDQWVAWLEDHELTVTATGRQLPVIPTRGNHEGAGPLFDEVWDHPGGEKAVNWFSMSLSPDVLLVTLNTETAAGGDQLEFLHETLDSNRHRRWKLVQYHRPIFPAVKGPARAKQHWQPLFDEHLIDLVLESDGHVLKRTVPILGDEQHEEGVVYIGEGGLGVAQRRPQSDRWYLEPPGTAQSAHHVWVVGVTRDTLELEAVGVDGKTLDRSTIEVRDRTR